MAPPRLLPPLGPPPKTLTRRNANASAAEDGLRLWEAATGLLGGPAAPPAALTGRQLTVTAVTQRELALFLGASAQARRHRVLRDELLALLEAGASVEPGPLAARVERVPHRVLSVKALKPVLGEDRVRQLQEAVGPTLYRHLVVSEAPQGAGKGSPGLQKGFPVDDPFYSDLEIMGMPSGLKATVTARAPDHGIAYKAAVFFFGHMLDALTLTVNRPMYLSWIERERTRKRGLRDGARAGEFMPRGR